MPSANELVQSCTSVFTLPEIYFRVRDVVEDPNSTMDDLAEVLKLDPAISARLLRIVNSPLYGFSKQIDTVTRAVNGCCPFTSHRAKPNRSIGAPSGKGGREAGTAR